MSLTGIIVSLTALFLTLLGGIALKRKQYAIVNLKGLAVPVLGLSFILCLIIFPKTAVEAAARGIDLWLTAVFPSLFPFFVASELLNGTGLIRAAGVLLEPLMRPLFNIPGCGSFALAMGVTSGYPVGARITAGMKEANLLSKAEAERLLAFTNNSGPLFIIGTVATRMFGLPHMGIYLLLCHIAACITVGLACRFYKKNQGRPAAAAVSKRLFPRFKQELFSSGSSKSVGMLLGDAVKNSVGLLLAIGGYIIIFSVIIQLLLDTGFIGGVSGVLCALLSPLGIDGDLVSAVLSGFFEITTGAKMASSAADALLIYRLSTASFIMGWAGLSVHFQVAAVVRDSGISIKPYIWGKFMQGILAALYTYTGLKLFGESLLGSLKAFEPHAASGVYTWYRPFAQAFTYFTAAFLIIAGLILLSLLYWKITGKIKSSKRMYKN